MAEAENPTLPLRWTMAGATDTGRVRDHNEDSYVLAPELGLVCVCDGMGGHASGEVASEMAADAVREFIAASARDPDATWPFGLDPSFSLDANRLATAVRVAAVQLYAAAEGQPELRGMGTTLVAAFLGGSSFAVAHAGDSRAWLLREGNLRQLTRDHSLLQEYVDARHPSEAEIAAFPHKNVITRALGLEEDVAPDLREERAQPGDLLILATDGLHGMVSAERIKELLCTVKDLDRACEALVEEANEAGGYDNITVALALASQE